MLLMERPLFILIMNLAGAAHLHEAALAGRRTELTGTML